MAIFFPLLFLIGNNFGFMNRKIDVGIFFDNRIQMLNSWLEQLVANPFLVPNVGPPSWEAWQHFHNFFADVHRISGVFALVMAVTLIMYIFIRLIYLTYRSKSIGLYLLGIAAPIFLIMVSSVVPEGEKQPFLVFLMIGMICDAHLSCNSKRNVLYGNRGETKT